MTGKTKLAGRSAPCYEIRLLGGGRLFHQEFNCFASRSTTMTGSSKRQKNSFLQNSATPFSRLRAGFFSPPKVTALEGFLLRAFFAVVVAYTFRFEVPFSTQPHPSGLAHFFDLTWLSNPASYSMFRAAIYFLLVLYMAGVLLPITLPLLALGHVLTFTLYNSQGYTHHGFQIVSLTLVAQAGTVLYDTFCRGVRLRPPDALLNSWLLWQSQVVVVGTYLISVFSKLINSRGLWLWNSSYIATDLIKSRRQLYYGSLDPNYAGNPAEAMWLLENPWMARALFGTGFVLEAIAFLALANRKIAFVIGIALILMHRSIAGLMGLRFDNNEMLCAIYLVGLPFLAAWCLYRIGNPTVRLGVLIGIGVGIPLSYFAQPASIQMAMPLPVYLSNLIESLDVWHNGRVTDFFRLTLRMWMTCIAMALAGAIGARLFGETMRKHRLPT